LLRAVRRIVRAIEIEDEVSGVLVRSVGVGTEPVDARARETLNRRPVLRQYSDRRSNLVTHHHVAG
jgi:hypothetical protein